MTSTSSLGNNGGSIDTYADRRGPDPATQREPAWASTLGSIGWVVLLAISVVGVLNHVLAVFTFATVGEEQQMFALFAGINAYAIAVLASPYRRHQRWAWIITWLEVAAFASVLPLLGGVVGLGYLVVAAVAALAQLFTLPSFWSRRTPRR